MANLKNTNINDTGHLIVPVGTSTAAGTQGTIRYDPATNRPEVYKDRDHGRWEPMINPFLTRQIVTTGYLHGGYANSTVWNNTNRVTFSTDTTINLGDNTQEAAHNYQCSAFNNLRNFTFGAGNGHCVAASNVICFNMVTESSETSGYSRSFPVAQVNSGVVQQEQFLAWWQNSSYSSSIYEFNLTTNTGYTAITTGDVSGQLWGNWNSETYGVFWNSSVARTFTFATRTQAVRSGTLISGDGYQHQIQFKQGYSYAGREGNPSTNWRKTNMWTNTSADAIGAKPYYSGEENAFTGQDWGYVVGWYQGSHVNTAFKFVYATEIGYGTTSSLEAKGKSGNSSATMSWRG